MAKEKEVKSTFLEKLSNKNRVFLIVIYAIALLLDVISIIGLSLLRISFIYSSIPLAYLVLDTVFMVISFTTNPRLRYSRNQLLIFILVSLIGIVLTSVFYFFDYKAVTMTVLAWLAFVLSHLFIIVAVIFVTRHLRHEYKHVSFGRLMIWFLTSGAVVAGYTFFLYSYGYFGQGQTGRVISYELNQETNTYRAKKLLDGYGTSVVVPKKFNGRPVDVISLDIFNDENINQVIVEDRPELIFEDYASFNPKNAIHLELPYSFVADFKDGLYNNALESKEEAIKTKSLTLANSIEPTNVPNNKVYININYGFDELEYGSSDRFLVFDKGYVLTDNDIVNPSLKNVDLTNPTHLYTHYQLNKKIPTNFVGDNQLPLYGQPLDKSYDIDIKYEDVFLLTFDSGNDSKYTAKDEDINTYVDDVKVCDGKPALLSDLYHYVELYSRRDGFALSFDVTLGEEREHFENEAELKNLVSNAKRDPLINVTWTLDKPVITVNASKTNLTYGEDIDFTSTASHTIKSGITYTYQWYYGSTLLSSNDSFSLIDEVPTNSGLYSLKVTTHYNKSSLTSSETSGVDILINKKNLTYVKDDPSSNIYTYDGLPKNYALYTDAGEIIEDSDKVNASIIWEDFVNAGTTLLNPSDKLSADFLSKYAIVPDADSSNYQGIINRRVLTLSLEDKEITYNGYTFTVFDDSDYHITNLVAGDVFEDLFNISPLVTNPSKNVGEYVLSAHTERKNVALALNYEVDEEGIITKTLTISKRHITAVNWTDDDFTFNGNVQYHRIDSLTGAAEADNMTTLLNAISYGDTSGYVNANDYLINANVDALTNYVFDSSAILYNNFSIVKYDLANAVKTSNIPSYTYNGTAFEPEPTIRIHNGAQVAIDPSNYIYSYLNNTNAGSNTASVTLNSKVASINYTGSISYYFSIAKANPTFATNPVKNTNMVYNTNPHELLSDAGSSGAINTEVVFRLNSSSSNINDYSSIIPTATNAGTYRVYYAIRSNNDNYNNLFVSDPVSAIVIEKANPTVATNPAGKTSLVYTGSSQYLIETEGEASPSTNISVVYKVGSSSTNINDYVDSDFIKYTNAGTYDVYYALKSSNPNYNNVFINTPFSVTIDKAVPTFASNPTGKTALVYNTNAQTLLAKAGSSNVGNTQVVYKLGSSSSNINDYSSTVPTGTDAGDAGDYSVYYAIKSNNANYYDYFAPSPIDVTIAKANPTYSTPTGIIGLVYDGTDHALVNAGSSPISGTTMLYKLGSKSEDINDYGSAIPTGNHAGTYSVYYAIKSNNPNYNDMIIDSPINVTIAQAIPTYIVPTAKTGLTYNGSSLTLINAGSVTTPTGAEVVYRVNSSSTDIDQYDDEVPAAVNAGTYNIYYAIKANNADYKDRIIATPIVVTIAQANPTFSAPTARSSLIYDGNTKVLVNAGGVTVPDEGAFMVYKLGSASTDINNYSQNIPTATNAGTHFVYYAVKSTNPNYKNYFVDSCVNVEIAQAEPTFSSIPSANDLTYTGQAQALVSPGTITAPSGAQWVYRLGSASGDIADYSTSIPTAINAGSYEVYYGIKSNNSNYRDLIMVNPISVTIAKANPTYTAPSANALTYNGETQALVTAGTTSGGTLQYSLTSGANYSTSIPTGLNAGSYTVYYKIVGNDNYNAVAESSVNVTIAKASITPVVSMDGWTYGATPTNPSVSGNTGSGEVTYEYKVQGAAESTYSTTKPTNAGSYTVRATIAATPNYSDGVATTNFTIAKANLALEVSIENWDEGDTPNDPVLTGNIGSGAVTYEYKLSTDPDTSYSTDIPEDGGSYTLRATVMATTNYNGASITCDFNINGAF